MFGYERVNMNVFRRCLKTSGDCADVTCDGRSFQMLAPETGNARLPVVAAPETGNTRLPVVAAPETGNARLPVVAAND